jgi:ABC-type molybdate transport system permease subunit
VQIAPAATLISVTLGTLAAIGLSQPHVPFRRAIMAILISPMIVPLIISAAGMYFFYSRIGLQGTYWGVVLAHAALGIPFVIITVTATLVGFDKSLTRAAANMGADPVTTFFRVQMPLILPGVISGGLFAFITSFDEVVVVLFVGSAGQKTLPWQMFTGLREQISDHSRGGHDPGGDFDHAADGGGTAAPPVGAPAGHVARLTSVPLILIWCREPVPDHVKLRHDRTDRLHVGAGFTSRPGQRSRQ